MYFTFHLNINIESFVSGPIILLGSVGPLLLKLVRANHTEEFVLVTVDDRGVLDGSRCCCGGSDAGFRCRGIGLDHSTDGVLFSGIALHSSLSKTNIFDLLRLVDVYSLIADFDFAYDCHVGKSDRFSLK